MNSGGESFGVNSERSGEIPAGLAQERGEKTNKTELGNRMRAEAEARSKGSAEVRERALAEKQRLMAQYGITEEELAAARAERARRKAAEPGAGSGDVAGMGNSGEIINGGVVGIEGGRDVIGGGVTGVDGGIRGTEAVEGSSDSGGQSEVVQSRTEMLRRVEGKGREHGGFRRALTRATMGVLVAGILVGGGMWLGQKMLNNTNTAGVVESVDGEADNGRYEIKENEYGVSYNYGGLFAEDPDENGVSYGYNKFPDKNTIYDVMPMSELQGIGIYENNEGGIVGDEGEARRVANLALDRQIDIFGAPCMAFLNAQAKADFGLLSDASINEIGGRLDTEKEFSNESRERLKGMFERAEFSFGRAENAEYATVWGDYIGDGDFSVKNNMEATPANIWNTYKTADFTDNDALVYVNFTEEDGGGTLMFYVGEFTSKGTVEMNGCFNPCVKVENGVIPDVLNDVPEIVPGMDNPTPETSTPEAPTPEAPTPETPTPDKPTPETPTPDKPTPKASWGKSGDTHAGNDVEYSDLVDPGAEVTREQNDATNRGNQGYVDDSQATPGSGSESNGVNGSGFTNSGITAPGASTEETRLEGGADQSGGEMAGENAYQNAAEIQAGQAVDEAANQAQEQAQSGGLEVGGDNLNDAAEEAAVENGGF